MSKEKLTDKNDGMDIFVNIFLRELREPISLSALLTCSSIEETFFLTTATNAWKVNIAVLPHYI